MKAELDTSLLPPSCRRPLQMFYAKQIAGAEDGDEFCEGGTCTLLHPLFIAVCLSVTSEPSIHIKFITEMCKWTQVIFQSKFKHFPLLKAFVSP